MDLVMLCAAAGDLPPEMVWPKPRPKGPNDAQFAAWYRAERLERKRMHYNKRNRT